MPAWTEMFDFGTPALEIFLRGSITYAFIFTLLRLVLKRETDSSASPTCSSSC